MLEHISEHGSPYEGVLKEASEDFDNLNQALRTLAASIEDHINTLTLGKKPEDVNAYAKSISEGKTAVFAGHVFEEHPDDLIKIIGLFTYQNSPEREFDIRTKETYVECNGIRFKEFIVEGRKA